MTFSIFRIGAVAAAMLACASPSAAAVPGGSPRHPTEILAEFGADDLAWTAPRMRTFLHDWFGVSRPDQPLCAPAGKTMPWIDILCEAAPAALPDRIDPPTLVLGIRGTEAASARIVAFVSDKAIVSDRWRCQEVRTFRFLCAPRSSDGGGQDTHLAEWARGLSQDMSDPHLWGPGPEVRYSLRKSPRYDKADLPVISRGLYRGLVDRTVHMERLVAVGRACRSLSEADAAIILDAARAEMLAVEQDLAAADRPWAALYLQTIRTRPARPGRTSYATDAGSCRRFAEPYGTLSKLLTWTGRPQEAAPGISASPQTIIE